MNKILKIKTNNNGNKIPNTNQLNQINNINTIIIHF